MKNSQNRPECINKNPIKLYAFSYKYNTTPYIFYTQLLLFFLPFNTNFQQKFLWICSTRWWWWYVHYHDVRGLQYLATRRRYILSTNKKHGVKYKSWGKTRTSISDYFADNYVYQSKDLKRMFRLRKKVFVRIANTLVSGYRFFDFHKY